MDKTEIQLSIKPNPSYKPKCSICDDATVLDTPEGRVNCGCYNNKILKEQLDKLRKRVGEKVWAGIESHSVMKYQSDAGRTAIEKSIWLHGKTRIGKTHIIAMAIKYMLSKDPFLYWLWLDADDITDAVQAQFNLDHRSRYDIDDILGCDILIIDDIHNMKPTETREREIFKMFKKMPWKRLYVTSNFDIQEFCFKFSDEKVLFERDKASPLAERFFENLEEILLKKD